MKKTVFLIVCSVFVLLLLAAPAIAGSNSVTFDNQSGEIALVKLVCPSGSAKEITVPNGAKRTIGGVDSGNFFIKIRYGSDGSYRYSKGQNFNMNSYTFQSIEAVITLHPVTNGNYRTSPISAEEFNR